MIKAFLFILAVVNSDGSIDTHYSFVEKCPSQSEVTEMLKPLKNKGQILGWGGKCERYVIPPGI